jgi:hypothetical protein
VQWWRERCLEWCHDYFDSGRFADQKYLDRWPQLFEGVVVAQNPGIGVGPWNLGSQPVTLKDGVVYVGQSPMVCFHYHGFRRLWRNLYDPNVGVYGVSLNTAMRQGVFASYAKALRESEQTLASLKLSLEGRCQRRGGDSVLWKRLWRNMVHKVWLCRSLLTGRVLWIPPEVMSRVR